MTDMENINFPRNLQFRFPTYSSIFQSERKNIEEGDKIILPEEVIFQIMHSSYHKNITSKTVIFRIENKLKNKVSHCGVLEFYKHDRAFLPHWMMENLLLQPGDLADFILVENYYSLNFVSLKPLSSNFSEMVEDPKHTLEEAFRKFTVLTKGDTILIKILGKKFTFFITKIEPSFGSPNFGCIVNSDLKVEFETPVKKQKEIFSVLKPNTPSQKSIKKGESIYHAFQSNTNFNCVLFTLESLLGDADIYVSTTNHKPDANDNEWENYLPNEKIKTIKAIINKDKDKDTKDNKDSFKMAVNNKKWVYISVSTLSEVADFVLKAEQINEKSNLKSKPNYFLDNNKTGTKIFKDSKNGENSEEKTEEKNGSVCGNCRQSISKRAFPLHVDRCKRLNVWCEECEKAIPISSEKDHLHCKFCGGVFKGVELEKHLKVKHRQIKCDCGVEYLASETFDHKQVCINELVKCNYCKSLQKRGELTDHEASCRGRTVNCEFCNEILMIKDLENHKEHCYPKEAGEVKDKNKPDAIDVEAIMVETALRNSLKDINEGNSNAFNANDREYQSIETEKTVECPYCSKLINQSAEDVGIHMLTCAYAPGAE